MSNKTLFKCFFRPDFPSTQRNECGPLHNLRVPVTGFVQKILCKDTQSGICDPLQQKKQFAACIIEMFLGYLAKQKKLPYV